MDSQRLVQFGERITLWGMVDFGNTESMFSVEARGCDICVWLAGSEVLVVCLGEPVDRGVHVDVAFSVLRFTIGVVSGVVSRRTFSLATVHTTICPNMFPHLQP